MDWIVRKYYIMNYLVQLWRNEDFIVYNCQENIFVFMVVWVYDDV